MTRTLITPEISALLDSQTALEQTIRRIRDDIKYGDTAAPYAELEEQLGAARRDLAAVTRSLLDAGWERDLG